MNFTNKCSDDVKLLLYRFKKYIYKSAHGVINYVANLFGFGVCFLYQKLWKLKNV